MRVPNRDLTGFCLRVLKFLFHVAFENVKVQLFLSSDVQPKTPHFALDLSLSSLVTIVLGARSSEFDNVIASVQFVGEFSQVVTEREFRLARFPRVDDAVCVEVLRLLWFQGFQRFVQFETSPASGETSYEYVYVGLHWIAFGLVIVNYLQHFFIHNTYVVNFFGVVAD